MSLITTFTTVGTHTFTVPQNRNYDILLVGGGGGGGSYYGGGGGGGAVTEKLNYRLNAGTYQVNVGDGGNPANSNSVNSVPSSSGNTSSITSSNIEFIPLYAAGGAGCGTYGINPQATPTAGDKIKGNFSSGGGAAASVYTNKAGSGGTGNGVSGNG